MNASIWFAVIVPLICVLVAVLSAVFFCDDTDRNSTNSLAVLSGMLAALAILIPLGAIFLPNGNYGWQALVLVGALGAAIVCMFGTIFSMIQLQKLEKFKTNGNRYVPASINATWIALLLLSAAIVIAKIGLSTNQPSNDYSNSTAQLRFTVAHDLPDLGTSGPIIKQQWGMPAQENNSALIYRTKNGLTVFCLDSQGLARAIIETKEAVDNVSKSVCQPNATNKQLFG